jgi:mannose-6-phosphate isomerase
VDYDKPAEKVLADIDSFVIYICIEGQAKITCPEVGDTSLEIGECVLIPAAIDNVFISPLPYCKLLETYIL